MMMSFSVSSFSFSPFSISLLFVRFSLLLLLGLSLPSFAADLPLLLETLPNKTFTDVQNRATAEAVNGPVWGNAPDPKTLTVYQTFRGTVTADATMTKLAIFSDDGSDVFVDGVKVWSGKDQGQSLPVLSQSLHELPVTLTPGSHSVEIDYSNTFYVPADASKGIPPDIDGCTLFEYGPAPMPVVTATSGLTGSVIRACAGAVADPVHEATVTLHAALNGASVSGLSLVVAFDTSVDYTGCHSPQLLDDQNQGKAVSTLTRTTDANGNITVTLLSSDLISQPNLIVTDNGGQVGSIGCDFAQETSRRRFPAPDEVGDPSWSSNDTGWLCDANQLINIGDQTPAKVYVKFMKDPSQGDIDGNWYFVNNHQVHLRIDSVTLYDGMTTVTDPAQLDQYVGFLGGDGSLQNAVAAITQADGAAQSTIQAGPLISNVAEINFAVDDRTQLSR